MDEKIKKRFLHDIQKYTTMTSTKQFPIKMDELWPVYEDDESASSAGIDPHYFLQDIYMAKEIMKQKVDLHYDIGSSVTSFIAHLLCFGQKTVLIDIRPLPWEIENLTFIQSDATLLENIADESIESLSSLHAVEHFGLGRYGDPVNPESWRYALSAMQRVLKKGGRLYLSVPVGRTEKVVFNAHRIFHPHTIISALPELVLEKMAYVYLPHVIEVPAESVFHTEVPGEYLAGCFIFHKPI